MKWTIEYVESGGYFKVINEGTYEARDSIGILADLFSNARWQPGTPILFDNRLADFSAVNYRVMSETTFSFAENNERLGSSRVASLVGSPLAFGISRQFQTLMAEKGTLVVEIFTDEAAAIGWLTEPQSD